ncbi:MAG: hypothetical protein K2M06_08845 [Muribaculaceae bacterium]|nr:hypothetical protein [Muribaculaceae bacterium]
MKKSLLLIVLLIAAAASAFAQQPPSDLSEARRDKYISEIRQYKHECIARELDLTKEQQREFFPVYDEMEDQIMKLSNETRELERKTDANPDASEAELEAAAIAIYSQRLKEGQIEMAFYEKFSKILNNRQILRLKNTERKFTQRLMKHHRNARKDASARDASSKRQK